MEIDGNEVDDWKLQLKEIFCIHFNFGKLSFNQSLVRL